MCEAISMNRIYQTNYIDLCINTDKLSKQFLKIDTNINDHENKINKMNIDFMKMYQSLQSKLAHEVQKNNMLFTKFNKQIIENSNLVKLYVADLDKNIKSNQTKISNISDSILLANSVINKVGDNLKHDLVTGLLSLKEQIIGKQQSTGKLQNNELPLSVEQHDTIQIRPQNFSATYNYFQAKISQLQNSIPAKISKILLSQKQKNRKIEKEQFMNKGLMKQKITRELYDKQNKDHSAVGRFLYPNTKIVSKNQMSQAQNNLKNDEQAKPKQEIYKHQNRADDGLSHRFLMQVQDRLHRLQVSNQNKSIALDEINNKIIVNEEKNVILHRKIDKLIHQLGQMRLSMRRLDAARNDDKGVEELRNYVKWAIRDLQEKMGAKCDRTELELEKKKIFEKISIIHENLLQKAEKGQIQKALIFLEGKIKQIIILIASEQSEERDGAMVKTAIKCLSCDKDLQKIIAQNDKKQSKQSGNYSRSLTHRTRQKYKQSLKQTLTSGNQSVEYL